MALLGSFTIDLFVLLLTGAFIIYKYFTRNYDYWEKRGVPYVKPLPVVGNFLEVFTFRTTIGHYLATLYNTFKTPYFGMYVLNKPHLVIRNPDLIKSILVKDFNYFYDRTVVSDEKCDSMSSKMLFLVKNPEWKALRSKITPAFTTGKIKNMFELINEAATDMTTYVEKNLSKDSIETKEMCAKYTTDVIASCAFGITANSFRYENAEFRQAGRKIFDFQWKSCLCQNAYFVCPSIVKFFKLPFKDRSAIGFLRNAFWKTIEEREKTGQKRNDLIDIIIQMKKENETSDVKLEGETILAQAGQFFSAGFETTSATMGFTLYEICLQPKIQNKLRTELKEVFSKYGGFTYEAVQDLKYLHMAVCETLRKYPVLPFLDRMCMKDYRLPGTDLVIEKGTPVYIPMFGLHYDPEYFPEPEKYDPERFSEENKHNLPSFSYIPFGEGPRSCIGERFGLLVTKLGLAHLLLEYELERSEETPVPLKFETKTFILASTIGLPMKMRKTVSHVA